ncbi:MAG: excinuclease ABC subunit UvrB [Proteobacteria bacterium]|jgi:excinuclease ABC subunit B|nr:excinuclease ABC subunit UvrB [Pseudomonadota bacterium]MBT3517232.1 excinuclease ABC subunit UvrB [Nitrospina sp.]
MEFNLQSDFKPAGDQPQAIETLVNGVEQKHKHQVLLGITGSGKTFAMANVVQQLQRPTLVIAHNKTLAAQLYNEFQNFFPENAVEYFVSYYDYYQPEAYVPSRDLYIEKDTALNDNLDRLRLSATRSLLERRDVLIVASVSCIYGIGSPEKYEKMLLIFKVGERLSRQVIVARLVELLYTRNDIDFHRGTFRVRGDVIDIYLAEAESAIRLELFGDEIESLVRFDPLTGKKQMSYQHFVIYPASHYVAPAEHVPETLRLIREELRERLEDLHANNKILEAQRLLQRTEYDLEMIEQTGSCSGIENYSRIMDRRAAGTPPATLLNYFPDDSLIFIDESHMTLPQLRAMYRGDYSRKSTLVEHGFRLPSAVDNRPLQFPEFVEFPQRLIYVSATPGDYEMEETEGQMAELVVRPTGLLEPVIEIRPVLGQVDDMLHEIRLRAKRKERVLVTTLTKRMAEDLTEYYNDLDVRVRYIHSDVDVVERTQILHDLRAGEFDVLVGINLLREGLDLPEVSLVGIFDADKEGFLRSVRSLVQTSGRASRNVNGLVIMYADRVTASMQITLDLTDSRRKKQVAYNKKHGIVPKTIFRKIAPSFAPVEMNDMLESDSYTAEESPVYETVIKMEEKIAEFENEMREAAESLEFERAAELRDRIAELRKKIAG